MIYYGHVKNGVVILEDAPVLPEGTSARVEIEDTAADTPPPDEHGQTLGQKLMKYAGKAVDLPDDAARNHDHYLYGTPKR